MSSKKRRDYIERRIPPKASSGKHSNSIENLQNLWDEGKLVELGKYCDSLLKKIKKIFMLWASKVLFYLKMGTTL
jgi:hypothetical protein